MSAPDISPCPTKELGGKTYRCAFELALACIGGKWKPIILYRLGQEPVMRFSDLRRSIADVTERMLSRQLRELEADGLLHREVFRQVPPKVEYSLTPMGRKLVPILTSLCAWGAEYEQRWSEEHTRPAARTDQSPRTGLALRP